MVWHLAPAHDAEHAAVKTKMLKLRLMEKRGQLCLQSDVAAVIDKSAGITLTALSSMPACLHPGDLVTRRKIEALRVPGPQATRRYRHGDGR
jgi:hypothetical protein